MVTNKRKTREIRCKNIRMGGDIPITIQSMTNTKTQDIDKTVAQILELEKNGCQIIRVAVPDMEAAKAIKKIKKSINIPLVADIHFDYKLAIESIKNGADKIRINPGNIGSEKRVKAIIDTAKAYDIPIRIGVNSGSVEKEIIAKYGGVTANGLVESAMKSIALFEKLEFYNTVLSVKSSNVQMNHDAHKKLAQLTDYPIHIGVTETGSATTGRLKSAIGIGALLLEGIGDTLRVSLTGNPVNEVILAKEILKATGIVNKGINIISCPTCGRCNVDLENISNQIEEKLKDVETTLTLSIMGCEVNGPGEARESDLGIACGKGRILVFKKGEIIEKTDEEHVVEILLNIIKQWDSK